MSVGGCSQGLDVAALGGLAGLGTNLPLPATRHSIDYLPRVPVQAQGGLAAFQDTLGLGRNGMSAEALGLGPEGLPALSAATTVPPADWDVYRGLGLDMPMPMNFSAPGARSIFCPAPSPFIPAPASFIEPSLSCSCL